MDEHELHKRTRPCHVTRAVKKGTNRYSRKQSEAGGYPPKRLREKTSCKDVGRDTAEHDENSTQCNLGAPPPLGLRVGLVAAAGVENKFDRS